jgi:lipopolysaccharide export LptBFGC system permease protein LptF
MSRTIFWYIFKDLVRVFLLTSGALAGIMSFGGLLRPLTRQGLDAAQVAKMLTFLGPAMTTYSFPIAALFATTVIYGRLSADNELTAFRAGGLSLASLSVAGPALVLGLMVATISLLFLCFVVPACTLRVEKVLYSNFAQLIANHIERTHEIDFGGTTIFAQEAWVPPPDPNAPPGQQQVVLRGPTIMSADKSDKADPTLHIPKEFSTASQAVIFIDHRVDDDQVYLTVQLEDGFRFPRKFEGSMQTGVKEALAGPIVFPSLIKEDTKFMDVWKLKRLFAEPWRSQQLRSEVADLVRADQSRLFLAMVRQQLNGDTGEIAFSFDRGEQYILHRDANAPNAVTTGATEISVKLPAPSTMPTSAPAATTPPAAGTQAVNRWVTFRREMGGRPASVVRASEMRFHATPDSDDKNMNCSLTLLDCVVDTGQDKGAPRGNFPQQFTVPIPPEVAALSKRGLVYYEKQQQASTKALRHDELRLHNQIYAESHNRASFAISCLILVMVGCALGMIFRSGNFLTAFAVSFIPALLSITLTIAGQRTAGNIPYRDHAADPLMLGLALIWTGNGINLILATALLSRLHRK